MEEIKPAIKKDGKLIANNGLEVREGYCHGCGKVVDKRVCICTTCIGRGITHKSLGIFDSEDNSLTLEEKLNSCPSCKNGNN